MLSTLHVTLIVSTALGFLSGLGVGGGSLLVLWLTAILDMDPTAARSINLLFFLPSALISCAIRMKQGKLQLKSLVPAIVAGTVAAAFFSWFSSALDAQILKKAFGILLLVTGLRELFYRPRNAR